MKTSLSLVIAVVFIFITTSCTSPQQDQVTNICNQPLKDEFQENVIAKFSWWYTETFYGGKLIENMRWVMTQRDSSSCQFVIMLSVNGELQTLFKYFVNTKDMMIYADDPVAQEAIAYFDDGVSRKLK